MFNVTANEIEYKNRVIARLAPMPLGFLREVEDTLRDFTTAADFDEDHEKELTAQYDEGFEAGKEDGAQDEKNKLEDERQEIENEAFERGRVQGAKDSAHAADAARVEYLLTALSDIHDRLMPLYLGIAVPDSYKRRPAKISEIKSAATSCCAAAKRAILAFRAT